MNKQGKNGIGWCDFTANPIRGKCLHNCPHCYAEAIRKRYNWPEEISYNLAWFNRKEAYRFYKINNRWPKIFVGSMHDIFGNWVSAERIQSVIFECKNNYSQIIFQFLTQNPARYTEFDWPDNCWRGTTVRMMDEMWRIERLIETKAKIHFVSFEPLLEKDELHYLRYFLNEEFINWLIVGCATDSRAKDCKLEWIESIVEQGQSASVPVYVKQIPIDGKANKNMFDWPRHLQIRQFPK